MTVPAAHNAQQAARVTGWRAQGRADCDPAPSFSRCLQWRRLFPRSVALSEGRGKLDGIISPWSGFREGAATLVSRNIAPKASSIAKASARGGAAAEPLRGRLTSIRARPAHLDEKGRACLPCSCWPYHSRLRRQGAPLLTRCARSSTRRSGCASPDGCAALWGVGPAGPSL